MAEILVRVVDKFDEQDFYNNVRCTKRGDVIAAAPDGWPWGVDERTSAQYRIIAMPGLSIGEAESLLAPEYDIDPNVPSKTLKRRAFRLDLDSLAVQKVVGDFLADATRAKEVLMLVETDKSVSDEKAAMIEAGKTKTEIAKVTVGDLLAVKIEKEATIDPAVIGGVVIG